MNVLLKFIIFVTTKSCYYLLITNLLLNTKTIAETSVNRSKMQNDYYDEPIGIFYEDK